MIFDHHVTGEDTKRLKNEILINCFQRLRWPTCQSWHRQQCKLNEEKKVRSIVKNHFQLEIVGIVSWGSAFPCGSANSVGVYVRTSAFIDWINQHVQ